MLYKLLLFQYFVFENQTCFENLDESSKKLGETESSNNLSGPSRYSAWEVRGQEHFAQELFFSPFDIRQPRTQDWQGFFVLLTTGLSYVLILEVSIFPREGIWVRAMKHIHEFGDSKIPQKKNNIGYRWGNILCYLINFIDTTLSCARNTFVERMMNEDMFVNLQNLCSFRPR